MSSAPRPDLNTLKAMPAGQAYRTVTAGDLATVWPRATLVDVRSREEHATAHVPGSLNIPLDELLSRLSDLPGGTLYLMCGSGNAAARPRGSSPTADTTRSMWPEESPSGTGQATPSPITTPRKAPHANDPDLPVQACAGSCTDCSTAKTVEAATRLPDTPGGIYT